MKRTAVVSVLSFWPILGVTIGCHADGAPKTSEMRSMQLTGAAPGTQDAGRLSPSLPLTGVARPAIHDSLSELLAKSRRAELAKAESTPSAKPNAPAKSRDGTLSKPARDYLAALAQNAAALDRMPVEEQERWKAALKQRLLASNPGKP